MYPWLIFLHVGAALFFMLAHGIHVVIMWRWRGAEDPELGLTLFNGLPTTGVTRLLLLAVILTGFALVVLGDRWAELWIWISLAVLVLMWVTMYFWGGGYFGLVQSAAQEAIEERQSGSGATSALEAYRDVRLGWRPPALMVIGIGGLGFVLWLMIFKPF